MGEALDIPSPEPSLRDVEVNDLLKVGTRALKDGITRRAGMADLALMTDRTAGLAARKDMVMA
jgi:hypothetical protein